MFSKYCYADSLIMFESFSKDLSQLFEELALECVPKKSQYEIDYNYTWNGCIKEMYENIKVKALSLRGEKEIKGGHNK